jgi:lipid-A-disaccharide synthase
VGGPPDRRLLIVAGEPSGDLHAARLIEALRALKPFAARGVTGPALDRAGVERVASMETLSVIGFTGVLRRLPRIRGVFRSLERTAREWRPQVAVLVDSPGFNFRLGRRLARSGVRVFYYIAPQVWAWHPERAGQMTRWVERLAVVFPFEEPLFRNAGVNARWVGHPLLDDLAPEVDEATWRRELGLPEDAPVLGLLPGSRAQEIERHLGILLETARRLAADRPGLRAVVALPGPRDALRIERHGAGVTVRGRTRATQAFSRACAVASGTATLETALFGTPLVVLYRTGWLNWEVGRRLVRLERIGLPNIVTGEEVAPELLQRELEPGRLAALLAPWLDDPALHSAQRARLARVRERLGGPGASIRAAEWLAEMLP